MSRLPVLIGVTGGMLLAAGPAFAAAHRDSSTSTVHKVSGSGATTVYEGTMRSSAFGRGTVHQVVRLGSGLKVTGNYTVRYKGGTLKGAVTAQAKIGSGGITFTGTAKVTGGTGRFKGAKGSARYTGTANVAGTSATFKQTGTIRF